MNPAISAWLEGGEPRLGIIDAETGRIRQLWRLEKIEAGGDPPQQAPAMDLQQLTRKLFLISCCQAIAGLGQQAADCRVCQQRQACQTHVATISELKQV